jgi:hypothetical protein
MNSRSMEKHFGVKRKRIPEEQEEDIEWMDGNKEQNLAKRAKHNIIEYIDAGDASEATDSRCIIHMPIGPQYRLTTNSQLTKAFYPGRYNVTTGGNVPSITGTMGNQSTDWWQSQAAWTKNVPSIPAVHQAPQNYSRQQTTNFVQTKNLIVHRGQEQHYMF